MPGDEHSDRVEANDDWFPFQMKVSAVRSDNHLGISSFVFSNTGKGDREFIFYKAEVSLSAVRSLHVELFWAAGAQCLRSGRLQLHDGPDPPEDAGEGHGQPDVQGAGGGRATGEQQHSQTVNTSELRTLITLKLLDINNHAKFYNF